MNEIKNDVLNAVESYLWRWCVHCDAKHSVDDITGPEEWWCSRGFDPGDEGCLKRGRFLEIAKAAAEIEGLIEGGN